MSLYNIINWVNPATFIVLPILDIHADNIWRFRDCFIWSEWKSILIYTRLWWWNREYHKKDIEKLRNIKWFIKDYDDDFDCTYATFEYSVPKEFEKDFNLIKKWKVKDISEKLKGQIIKIYPKLEKELKKIFEN